MQRRVILKCFSPNMPDYRLGEFFYQHRHDFSFFHTKMALIRPHNRLSVDGRSLDGGCSSRCTGLAPLPFLAGLGHTRKIRV